MSIKRCLVAAITALLGAGALSACAANAPGASPGSGGGSTQFVVGYSQSNNAEPYRAQLNLQLAYFIKKYPDLKLLPITDAHQDSATQVGQVQNFIQEHVNVLIVSPNEPGPLTAPVQLACTAGIPVIILDRTVNTNCETAFIGGDNYTIGKLAGEAAVKALPNGGTVAELQGILSDQPQIDRDKGFRDGIAGHNITIVLHQEDNWLRANATTTMQQWLSTGQHIDLVYGQNDEMALGAYNAANGAGKASQIKFIGTDGLAISTGGIRAVELGQLYTTFVYPTCAQQAADAAEAIVHKKPVRKSTLLPTVQVTKANAPQLYSKFVSEAGGS